MRNKYIFSTILVALLTTAAANAQVGFGTNTPDPSSVIDMVSAKRGVLVPRIALTSTNVAGPVISPAEALWVYNTATAGTAPNNVTPGFYYWSVNRWVRITNNEDITRGSITSTDLSVAGGTNATFHDVELNINDGAVTENKLKAPVITGTPTLRIPIAQNDGTVEYGEFPATGVVGDNLGAADNSIEIVSGGIGAVLVESMLQVKALGITEAKLANNAVTNDKVADNAIGNAELLDNAVNTAELVNNAVTNDKVADNAIGNAELLDNAVDTAEIVDGAVTAIKLDATGATPGHVATANADGSVTYQAIDASDLSNTGDLTAATETPASIVIGGDGADALLKDANVSVAPLGITNGKLAADAVTTDKIATGAVGTTDIADLAVTNGKLATDAVTNDKVADNAIGNAELLDNAVDTAEIVDGAVTAIKLDATGATPGHVATANADGSVTYQAIDASDLSNTGDLTAATETPASIVIGGDGADALLKDANVSVAPLGITNGKLAADAVTTDKIATGAVGTTDIADLAVTNGKLATDAVTNDKVADNAIGNAELLDNAVNTAELVNNAVTNDKVADNAIGNAELLDNAVDTAEIVDGAVTAIKLDATGATPGHVATANADGSVTYQAIDASDLSNTGDLTAASETPASIVIGGDGADALLKDANVSVAPLGITNGKLAADAVTTDKIATGAVESSDIKDGDIATVDIANLAVTTAKLANDAVDNSKLADNAVRTENLEANAVETSDIRDANVTAAKLTAGAVAPTDPVRVAIAAPNGTVTYGPVPASSISSSNLSAAGDTPASIEVATGGTNAVLVPTTLRVADLGITNGKLAADAVTTDKIATGAVGTTDIADLAVTNGKLAADAVTNDKVADNAIGNAELLDNAVNTAELVDGAVTTGKILNGTILPADVAPGLANQVLATDATASSVIWVNKSTLAIEPWFVQAAVTPTVQATTNTDNIVTFGTVAIKKNQAWTGVNLDVVGAVRGGVNTAGAVGTNSAAFGNANVASGVNAFATGSTNTASGVTAFAAGNANVASGVGSFAAGNTNTVNSQYSAVVGAFNAITTGTPGSWVTSDALFQVGNGTGTGARNNALTILKSGFTGLGLVGTATPAERFHVAAGNVRISDINTTTGLSTDKIVVADSAGTLKTINSISSLGAGDITGGTEITVGNGVDSAFKDVTLGIANDAITNAKMADDAIGNAEMRDNAINTNELVNLAVTTAKLANDAVDNTKLADNAVKTENIEANAVETSDIKDANVTPAKLTALAGAADRIAIADTAGVVTFSNTIPSGSITGADLLPTSGDASIVVTNGAGTTLKNTTLHVADLGIITGKLANDAVTNLKMADNAIGNAEMLDNAINTNELVNLAVTTAKLANDAVDNSKLADNAVRTENLEANAVETSDIRDANVTAAKLTAGAVAPTDPVRVAIAAPNGTVTYGPVPANSIASSNLAAAGDTPASIEVATGGTNAVLVPTTLRVADLGITTAKLAADAVTTAKIATGAVESSDIKDGDIATVDIANLAVTTAKLANDAVDNSKLADDAVRTENILNGTIALADMGTGSVNSTTIVDGSVDTIDLKDDSVTAAKINGGSVTVGSPIRVPLADNNGDITFGPVPANSIASSNLAAAGDTPASIEVATGGTNAVLVPTTLRVADLGITTAKLAADAVTTAKIATGAVESSDIKDGDIATVDIANLAVTTGKLANDAVDNSKLADDAVRTENILNATILAEDLAPGSVTEAKLSGVGETTGHVAAVNSNGTVTYQAITASMVTTGANLAGAADGPASIEVASGGAGAVLIATTLRVADLGITTNKLANDAVTNAKMADNAIGNAEMLDNAIGNAEMLDNAINTNELVNLAVTTAKLANDAVDNTKLADNAVKTENLEANAVETSDIRDANVTAAKLTAGAVAPTDPVRVAIAAPNGTVTYGPVPANSIASSNLSAAADTPASIQVVSGGANAVLVPTTLRVADLGITTPKLAADAVDNSKLADNAVQTENILNGTIALADMGTGSVNSTTIVDGSVDTIDLKDDSVTTAKIATGAVGNTDIAANAVTNDKMSGGNTGVANRVPVSTATGVVTYQPITAAMVTTGANIGGAADAVPSIEVASGGTGAVLVTTTLRVADAGITANKLATDAVTNAKVADNAINTNELVNSAVTTAKIAPGANNTMLVTNGTTVSWADRATAISEPWRIQNTANPATANTDNIYQAGKVAIGFGVSDAVSANALDVKTGTVRVGEIGTTPYTATATDKVVMADVNGVLRTAKSAMPKFFYMPAVIFDTSAYSGSPIVGLKRNLYNEYLAQFTGRQFLPDPTGTGGTVGTNPSGTFVASAGSAPATQVMSFLPAAGDLYYYITYYDTTVFDTLSIDINGVLTYTLKGNGTEASYMNIVFVVK